MRGNPVRKKIQIIQGLRRGRSSKGLPRLKENLVRGTSKDVGGSDELPRWRECLLGGSSEDARAQKISGLN